MYAPTMLLPLLAALLAPALAQPTAIDSNAITLDRRDQCTGYFAYGPLMNNEACGAIVPHHAAAQAAIRGVCRRYGACTAGSGTYPSGSYTVRGVTATLAWGDKCSNFGNQPTDTTVQECVNTYFDFYFKGGPQTNTGNGVCPENTGQEGHYVGGRIDWCDGSYFQLE